MSDNEDYYSDNASDSDSSSDGDIPVSKNVPNFKAAISSALNIKDYDDENSDEDVEDVDEDINFEDDIDEDEDQYEDNDIADQEGGADLEDEDENNKKSTVTSKQKDKTSSSKKIIEPSDDEDDEDYDDEDDDENYLQKFDAEINKSYVSNYHPECMSHNYDEISKLTKIVKDKNGIIIDPFHKTLPFLTKYEKTRILGQRAKQIENGAKPFVKIPDNIIDSYIIAELELQQKRIPFIIRRPLPCGGCEYWNLKDLEVIAF
jgi:DNA-directed RNA polymerases I, II, and III subunit RPABC2